MHLTVKKIHVIRNKVNEIIEKKQLKINCPEIIAVSKTFPSSIVLPLLESGHIHFGESKVQEAIAKWSGLKKKYLNIKLHFVGKLQSNKVKKAIQFFDYIHSLDSEKLALSLDKYQKVMKKKVNFFIQVNVGNEVQKNGIMLNDLKDFYNYCTNVLSLDVVGLMCLPPLVGNSEKYFKILKSASDSLNLKNLSIGMTHDYDKAILHGSTYLRLGTAIFGKRKFNQ